MSNNRIYIILDNKKYLIFIKNDFKRAQYIECLKNAFLHYYGIYKKKLLLLEFNIIYTVMYLHNIISFLFNSEFKLLVNLIERTV